MSFYYKDELIEFEIIYRNRKTLSIKIDIDGNIKVISPEKLSENNILNIVEKKASWIINKRKIMLNRKKVIPKNNYLNGEFYLYMGEKYTLKVVTTPKDTVLINHENKVIEISTSSKDKIRNMLEKFYREETFKIVKERVCYYQKYFENTPKEIRVKQQKRRWGSCTFDNKLLFNWRLSMMPKDILDYVIVHEMCHMVYKNHSKDFWNDVFRVMPNYKEKSLWLRENGIKIDL
ncbi:M48 family metallopeptidase [Clostridium chauvoei]|uniref:YgjP-like metallopeptidase domain-containing protein n=2 Tax=Clostridium chauvoei TaxID=46867 RepID=S6FMB5_9CLOT|nr:SprT family zinc-dependent metalloprotease [Clostridium chauvoei]ATD55101.1 hypothetical protein BTM20_07555 [Clostridium chauvoei]ATD57225.1 hypothetical protein BTM21_05500 [Clostridium chauvoei]MBX7279446.1 M48 family metallopeptidase [Clostridium chauvoei]MBX7282468.1 M48 family metallopeptidase [Clostridium chauvoei]MBX7285645.1 M48 family metallopeptidase [Clostridium chauvoei]